jgi:phage tail sheath protein FI
MSALGVTINSRTAPAGSGITNDTGTAFVAGQSTAGQPTTPVECRSIADYEAVAGSRVSGNQKMYDWLDDFFREGGSRAFALKYAAGAGNLANALPQFAKDLGPGQIACVGSDTLDATLISALTSHAAANRRFALIDVGNGDAKTAMQTEGDLLVANANSTYGQLVGPWVTIPAPAGSIGGSARQVHASATVAALCNRADLLGNPNRAAAGRDFPLQYATGFVVPSDGIISDTDRATLLDHAVNTFATRYGVMEMYGAQTGLAQNVDNPFWQANVARLRMWLSAQADFIGERYVFKPLTTRLMNNLKTDLEAVLKLVWEADGLYGDAPIDAYSVNVSAAVNTSSTVAQAILRAVAEIRPSLHAKSVSIDLVTVPVTAQVS